MTTEPGSKYLPEKGRYSLYVSRACPSSHNVLLVHCLKGLEDIVSVTYVCPHPEDYLQRRWMITHEIPDDSLASFKSDDGEFTCIRDIYQKEHATTTCNAIPLLYDKHHECIVNNDATDIARMFNTCFNSGTALCQNPTLDLFAGDNDAVAQAKRDEVKTWLYPLLQLTPSTLPPYHYNVSPRELEYAFNRVTNILQRQRYLTSHTTVTDMDLRLFVTLIRYEEVYSKYLLPESPPQLIHNPALLDFCRDIYQLPGVAETVHMKEIRTHFLGSQHSPSAGAGSAVLALLQMPHKRHYLL